MRPRCWRRATSPPRRSVRGRRGRRGGGLRRRKTAGPPKDRIRRRPFLQRRLIDRAQFRHERAVGIGKSGDTGGRAALGEGSRWLERIVLALAPEGWLERFSRSVAQYFTANVWEATNRCQGTIPDAAVYCAMRLFTSAVYPCLMLIELTEEETKRVAGGQASASLQLSGSAAGPSSAIVSGSGTTTTLTIGGLSPSNSATVSATLSSSSS